MNACAVTSNPSDKKDSGHSSIFSYDKNTYRGAVAFIPHQSSAVMGLDVSIDGKTDAFTHGSIETKRTLVARLTPGAHVRLHDSNGLAGITITPIFGLRQTKLRFVSFDSERFRCFGDPGQEYKKAYQFSYGLMAMIHYKVTIGYRITDTTNILVVGYHL